MTLAKRWDKAADGNHAINRLISGSQSSEVCYDRQREHRPERQMPARQAPRSSDMTRALEVLGIRMDGEVMKEGTISSLVKTLSAHAVTALITLTLVFVISGGHLSGRLLPAQTPGPRREINAPPPPRPALEESLTSAAAVRRAANAHTPLPPEDVLKELDPDERKNVQVYAAANKGVVNITTEADGLGFFGDESSTGTGSGFVLDKQGHILTNYHVVQQADSVRVRLFDGTPYDAKVIGADASTDVAVLVIRVAPRSCFLSPLVILPKSWSVKKSWRWEIRSAWNAL